MQGMTGNNMQMRLVAAAHKTGLGINSSYCFLSVLCCPWVCARGPQAGFCAQEELKGMADRINSMRTLLFQELQRVGAPGKWRHIVEQIGMFSYTGLTRVR